MVAFPQSSSFDNIAGASIDGHTDNEQKIDNTKYFTSRSALKFQIQKQIFVD